MLALSAFALSACGSGTPASGASASCSPDPVSPGDGGTHVFGALTDRQGHAYRWMIGVEPSCGCTGNLTRFKDEWLRLQFATIDWAWRKGHATLGAGIRPLEGYCTFWGPDQPEVPGAFRSRLVHDHLLYEEMVRAAVPFDLRALRRGRPHVALRPSV